MLLRHTLTEVKDRQALTINPAKTCQPIGAMYAALGVHGCLPHSHGSQGCCAYHRSALTRHYKEPIMAATSSFTEGSSVFGGQANLLQAIQTIFSVYKPEVIAVHTTCLSETIGDDCAQIVKKAEEEGKVPEGKTVVYTATPSYVGSHVTGFSNMVRDFCKLLSEKSGTKADQINIIPGWVEPADMREMKRLASMMGINHVMLPDTSDVLDAPMSGTHEMYPEGGTTIAEIKTMGDSKKTVACGTWASKDAAKILDTKCKVPFELVDIPYGIKATDRYIQALSSAYGVPVPASVTAERGRLMDVITDQQQYFYNKRVALWGDPDQLIPMAEFLVSIGMKPVYIVSGTPGTKEFMARMHAILDEKVPEAKFKNGPQADMYLMHQWIKNESVDLLIGNTYGKYIARDENIPFIRHGFPIVDRIGHSYFPSVGYMGGIRLIEKMLGAMLDKRDAECDETKFELVL